MVGLVASTVGDRAKIAKGICVFQQNVHLLFPPKLDIVRMSSCPHPAFIFDMCVACGIRASDAGNNSSINSQSGKLSDRKEEAMTSQRSSVLVLSGGNRLQINSAVEAERIESSKIQSLQSSKKLALVLDLDHTLVHGK